MQHRISAASIKSVASEKRYASKRVAVLSPPLHDHGHNHLVNGVFRVTSASAERLRYVARAVAGPAVPSRGLSRGAGWSLIMTRTIINVLNTSTVDTVYCKAYQIF